MQRTSIFLGGVAAAVLCGAGGGAIHADRVPARLRTLGKVVYSFERERPWPRHDTSRATFRSDAKLRPLLLVGRNLGGSMTFRFEQAAGLGDLGGVEIDLGDAKVTTSGGFSVVWDRYSDSPDAERMACADWLKRECRYHVILKIDSMKDFRQADGDKAPRGSEVFQARVHGALQLADKVVEEGQAARYVVRRAVDIDTPATLTFRDGAASAEKGVTHASLTLRGAATLKGGQIGLTGDDAGDVKLQFMLTGYTDFQSQTEKLYKTRLDNKLLLDD